MKIKLLIAAVALLTFGRPAAANFLVELTFAQKMAQADLVAIATVTSVNCKRGARSTGGLAGAGSTARLSVEQVLKGAAGQSVEISTFSRISELQLRCLTIGATYLVFLTKSPSGELHSVLGKYGLIRVGGPPGPIRVLPEATH